MQPSVKYFRPGQYVFREGDLPNAMYLVKKGTIAVRKRKGTGQIELGRIYASEILGELSFFDRQPRSASALAVSEVEILELSFESLDRVYQVVPDYWRTIMAAVAERLRKANETIRRLQKDVVDDANEFTGATSSIMSATDALSALDGLTEIPSEPKNSTDGDES